MSEPVLIALFYGGDSDNKEEGQAAGDWAGGGVDDKLDQKYDQEVEVSDSSELLKQVLGYEVPERILGGDDAVVGVTLRDVGLSSRRGFLMPDVHCSTVHPVLLPHTESADDVPETVEIHP